MDTKKRLISRDRFSSTPPTRTRTRNQSMSSFDSSSSRTSSGFCSRSSLLSSISFVKSCKDTTVTNIYPSDATYKVVKLVLTATDLQNLDRIGQSDPYFKIYGYNTIGNDCTELLYTSEVVRSCVHFVEWKPAIFGVPKGWNFKKFKIFIFDKEVIGKDLLLAGPVDIPTKESSTYLEIENSFIHVNKFEKL